MPSFIDAATGLDILQLKKDAFDTLMMPGIGTIKTISLYRDPEQDGTGTVQPAQTVRVVFYSRPGQGGYIPVRDTGADLVVESGEFQKQSPFNVATEDRFTLDGIAGTVTHVYPADERGVIRAAFVLES